MAMCKCGGVTEKKEIKNYLVPGALLGVEGVTLDTGVTDTICKKCGKGKIFIPDVPGLITAVALTRVKLPFKLNSGEIKFVRKALDMTSKQMADLMKVTPETFSRWENEKMPMVEASERFFRLISIAMLMDRAEAVDPELQRVVKMEIKPAYEQAALGSMMHFVRVLMDRKVETEELWKDEQLKVANG